MVKKEDYIQCLEELIDFEEMKAEEKSFLLKVFLNIFYAYDRNQEHKAPADELARLVN